MLGEIIIPSVGSSEPPSIFRDPWALLVTSGVAIFAIFIKEHITRLQDRHTALQDKLEDLIALLGQPPMWAPAHITNRADADIEVSLQLGYWVMKVDAQVKMHFPVLLNEWKKGEHAWNAYIELLGKQSQHLIQRESGVRDPSDPVYPPVPFAEILKSKQDALGLSLEMAEDAVEDHRFLTSQPRFYIFTRRSFTYRFFKAAHDCVVHGW